MVAAVDLLSPADDGRLVRRSRSVIIFAVFSVREVVVAARRRLLRVLGLLLFFLGSSLEEEQAVEAAEGENHA